MLACRRRGPGYSHCVLVCSVQSQSTLLEVQAQPVFFPFPHSVWSPRTNWTLNLGIFSADALPWALHSPGCSLAALDQSSTTPQINPNPNQTSPHQIRSVAGTALTGPLRRSRSYSRGTVPLNLLANLLSKLSRRVVIDAASRERLKQRNRTRRDRAAQERAEPGRTRQRRLASSAKKNPPFIPPAVPDQQPPGTLGRWVGAVDISTHARTDVLGRGPTNPISRGTTVQSASLVSSALGRHRRRGCRIA